MKKIYVIGFVFLLSAVSFAQAPQAFNYQAVICGCNGDLLSNLDINLKISILKDSVDGNVEYSENHSHTTTEYGLINIQMGQGTVLLGAFDSISWADSYHFLKIEVDTTDGTNWWDMGTTQLRSVPYALEAKHSSSLTLTDSMGYKHVVTVDPDGELRATIDSNVILGMPCPGIETIEYEGQIYNTVQIGNQCWLKENLNVGTRVNLSDNQIDDGMIEKYCYDDIEDSCLIYGGLYQWNEAMQYATLEGTQGFCPDGWHIPTDEEFKILEGSVDRVYPVGDSEWNNNQCRNGYDAGGKLKSSGTIENGSGHWYEPNYGASNESGFTGLPAGRRSIDDDLSHYCGFAGY